MTTYHVHNTDIECIVGDIAAQSDVQAVVNAANAELQIGGGVAGALHRAAGPGLAQECAPMAPIRPGEAVISGGHGLPNNHVIHVLGPVYGADEPAADYLAACHREAIRLAQTHGIASIAFPAISTGAFGYPLDEAADVAAATVCRAVADADTVTHVRFVLFTESAREAYAQALAAHAG